MKAKKKEPLYVNKTAEVEEFMNSLDHPLKAEIEAIRKIIKNANDKIGERVKWNAPSFFYKMDMAAFNLRTRDYAQLIFIFPKGLIEDDGGLLLGEWRDRREARFYDKKDVLSKKQALQKLVNDWITLIDQSLLTE